ncbi:coiled-coil domain-containing protein [Nocardiopsis lambiniae]|uniref:ARB-07466-like C-terminal domain-containing protein n=1 Tax=Nocardiopsis lambiniae TaxID=3075539 RepID=A0ABU2M4T1_9ACTN|nr:hypothetical protein [Nocardiopsis sp. DSM 44743]MDT0327326.1 hypothetical protein [Nocardiopsis sp. DSM 44743]
MQSDDQSRVDEFADFWAPDRSTATWGGTLSEIASALPRRRAGGAVSKGRVIAVAVALGAALVAVPQTPVLALPMEPESMDSLRQRSTELSEEYNGELRDMEGVIQEAERAAERAESTADEVDASKEQVRALAYASYTNSGIDPSMSLFVEASPDEIIDRAVVIDYLATSNQDKIDQLAQALERDQKAQKAAEESLEEAEADLNVLEERRSEVQELIAAHPSQPMEGPLNITPRTAQMRQLVIDEFGEGKEQGGVGCYRAVGGWVRGEHPLGRACDFMLSKNGQMPPQDQIDRGWAIAEWSRENADRLGIMYVIYRQQIWDVRRGDTDWRAMGDRGNITENHFDHVHISMW